MRSTATLLRRRRNVGSSDEPLPVFLAPAPFAPGQLELVEVSVTALAPAAFAPGQLELLPAGV